MGDTTTYTLDELATAVGRTSRNVRAYRTRGLLPPPERSGRRAVYTEVHLHRLLAVRSTLAQGVPLNMIGKWIAGGRERDLGRAPSGPPPRGARRGRKPMDPELTQRLIDADAHAVGRLVELGVLSHDDAYLLFSPDLLATILELNAANFPLRRLLALCVVVAEAGADIAAELPGRNKGRAGSDLLIRLVNCAMEETLSARTNR
jgi:DNA-binding transcriptional MerR regulator